MGMRILLTAFSILFLCCVPKKGLEQPLELMLYGAERKLQEGDPSGAIEIYKEILEVVNAPEAWFGMSKAYLALSDTSGAMRSYFRGILAQEEQEQSDPYYWMRMGYLFSRRGETERAMEAFKKALSLAPDDAKAWNNMGVIHYEKGEYESAIPCFKKAIALDPNDQRFWYNLGLAYHHIGAYEDAISAYNASLHIEEARAKVWNDLGVTYRIKGEWEKALMCYDRALALAPEDPDIWFNKGLLLKRMGKSEEAMYCFMKQAEFAVSWKAYLQAGKMASDLNKFPLAWNLLDRALYYKPRSALVWAVRVYAGYKEAGLARAREEMVASERYLDEKAKERVMGAYTRCVLELIKKIRVFFR